MTYRFIEFPRVVYGPGGAWAEINSEAERPDGWVDHPDDVPAAVATQAERKSAYQKKKEAARQEVEKARVAELTAILDDAGVVIPDGATLVDLEALKVQLDEHLAAQVAGEGGDGDSA